MPQEKADTFTIFKSFKVAIEKEPGNLIKVLRTNRGREYISHEFENYCENHSIQRQLTAAYTPQQNRVCKRKNRTIINIVRSLLMKSGI